MFHTDNRNLEFVTILPVCRPDVHLAIKLLKWLELMGGDDGLGGQFDVWMAPNVAREYGDQLEELASRCGPGFSVVTCAGLKEMGYFGSANQMFKGALEHVESNYPGRAMLWMEADCVPMSRHWIAEIGNEYRLCERPFMGDVVRSQINHMTGVAMYHPEWRKYAPSFEKLPGPDWTWGWDSQCAADTLPNCHQSRTIRQVWRPAPFTDASASKIVPAGCSLFHQCKDGTLIDVLTDRMGAQRIPLSPQVEESTYPKMQPRRPTYPRVDILIVTFARDMDFLRYCLASIKRYAQGFSQVVVVVPSHERGQYDWIGRDAVVKYFDEAPGKGMLSHEIQKCRADEWCDGADYVLHMDADCMFFRVTRPSDFLVEGRCLSVREEYARITNMNRHIWADVVEKATGMRPAHDYMVRHPQIHPREVYHITRKIVAERAGCAFDQYVLGCQNAFPQGFAEFPTLSTVGAVVMPGAYEYVEYDKDVDAKIVGRDPASFQYAYMRARDHVVEFWSHGGIRAYKSDCEAILAGRIPAYWVK